MKKNRKFIFFLGVFGLAMSLLFINPGAVGAGLTWPDTTWVSFIFDLGEDHWYFGDDFKPSLDAYDVELRGPRNPHITLLITKDGITRHGNYLSYWLTYQISYLGTGFGGEEDPPVSAQIRILGTDKGPPPSIAPIDEVKIVGGPFDVKGGTTYPTNSVDFIAKSLYGTENATIKVDYSRPIPVPAAAWLLGSGLIGLWGLRRKFSK